MRHVSPALLPSKVLVGGLALRQEVDVEAQQRPDQNRDHRRPHSQHRAHETASPETVKKRGNGGR